MKAPSRTPLAGRSQLVQLVVCSLISIPLMVISVVLCNTLFDPPRSSFFWQIAAIGSCCPFVVGIAVHWSKPQPLSQRLVDGVGLGLLAACGNFLVIVGAFAVWATFFLAS